MSSNQDPSQMALDLSRRCTVRVSPLHPSHTESLNLVRHAEWYRTPQSRNTDVLEQSSAHRRRHRGTPLSQGLGIDVLPKGLNGNLWDPGFYEPESSVSSISDSNNGDESQSDSSDVIFLVSSTRDTHLCRSFSSDSVSPIVDSLSSAIPSGDEGRGCFLLPQTPSSPSLGYTNSEDSSDSMGDAVLRSSPELRLSRLAHPFSSQVDISSDDSDVIEVPVTYAENKNIRRSCGERLAEKAVAPDTTVSPLRKELRRSARVRKDTPLTPKPNNSIYFHCLRSSAKSTNITKQNEDLDCGDMDSTGRLSDSDEEPWLQPTVTQRIGLDGDISKMEVHEASRILLKPLQKDLSISGSKISQNCNSKRKQEKPVSEPKTKKSRAIGISPKKRPPKKVLPLNKNAQKNNVNKRKRRKKLMQTGPASMFSPAEPEIRLKYANYKGERKEHKSDNFSPFIHVAYKECSVVNYQEEEERVKASRGRRHTSPTTFSTVIPKSSCFRVGRLGSGISCQPAEVCCLCGGTANASGLGDLHGPYYPVGPTLRHQSRGRKGAAPVVDSEARALLSNGHALDDSQGESTLVGESDGTTMLFPKEPVVVDCLSEMNQYMDECWVHEDCGIWSTGVFLVKGKLYGLEEAGRLARETVCSLCCKPGAIIGCFRKGCPAKYHYTCAIQSGCALNEENFSLRCCKHKDMSVGGVNR